MNTILFDLDGTLLPLDEKIFVDTYFGELYKPFANKIDMKTFVKYIWAATAYMRETNDRTRTNMELFMDKFETFIGEDLDEYVELFNDFYDQGFLKVQEAVSMDQYAIDTVSLLKEKGYTVILATNPLFPMKAVHHRIRWAGLVPEDFSHITSYENTHYCKPHVDYYQEILDVIGKEPNECMMVGNDVGEDLVAGKLGLKTFLVENHIINKEDVDIKCDYRGKYEDLFQYMSGLPSLV